MTYFISPLANRDIQRVVRTILLLGTLANPGFGVGATFNNEVTLVDSSHESMHWYYEGLKLRESGEYDRAVKSFNHFIRENPDHVYADRAQFLILDCHFKNREYALALSDSILFENRFADSPKYPQVLYQRALSYLSLGEAKKAQVTLNQVVNLYPRSSSAFEAKEKLLSLQEPHS